MSNLIDLLLANITLVVAIQQGAFSALSAICELFKWTTASKIFGTLTSLDLGRILRTSKNATPVKTGTVALVLLAFSCAGQQAPSVSAQQVVTVAEGAVAVTDAALSVAIDALPDGTDLAPWEERVKQLETVAQALREGKDQLKTVCDSMPTIRAVGELTKCAKCVEAATTIQTLACGGAK
jgi:hypothetical protein